MEAKDTVMSRKKKQMLIVERSHQQTVGETQEDMLLEAQAEISFKAGYEYCRKVDGDIYKVGVMAGRGEVVEFVEDRMGKYKVAPKLLGFTMLTEDWQSKLKEWGIINQV